jgi:hypothetical protein
MISQKLKEIEKDILSRLERINSYKCDNPNYFFSRNTALSLSSFDSTLLFGSSNHKLGQVEKIISTLMNGLFDDGALIFSMKNGQSVLTLVNDDLDNIQRLNKEDVKDITRLFNRANEYSICNSKSITNVLDANFGKKDHPSKIHADMVNEAKLNAVKFGWEPNEEQLTCVFGEL